MFLFKKLAAIISVSVSSRGMQCVKGRCFVLIGCICEQLVRSVMMSRCVRPLPAVLCFNDELCHNAFKAHPLLQPTRHTAAVNGSAKFRSAVVPKFRLQVAVFHKFCVYSLHCVPKKEATKLLAVTLSNLNRF